MNGILGIREVDAAALPGEPIQRDPNTMHSETQRLELIYAADSVRGHERLKRDWATAVGRKVAVRGHRRRLSNTRHRPKPLPSGANTLKRPLRNPLITGQYVAKR